MTETRPDPISSFLHGSDQALWSTAAIVLSIHGAASQEQQAAAHAVLQATGLDGVTGLGAEDAGGLAARAAAPIHQVAALLRGEGQMWAAQPDEALLAQGRASAQGAAGFAHFVLPQLEGLQEALAEGARMLDVGTGVAAMAVGRFKTIAYGGTALDDGQAEELLRSAGLVDVWTVQTPEGAPAITVGRKPTAS